MFKAFLSFPFPALEPGGWPVLRVLQSLQVVVLGFAILLGLPALAEGPVWNRVRTLPSADAHQAAAADDEFLYAISSTRIVKYDRFTDREIAVSSGPAKHLNSGFLWDGKLYCAHSNYPAVPEQSEILVLDPASMELTTFHEFGNAGGSLTWAIRDAAHWWCNFARYGESNAETFLVRYDLDWKETGRWTYPRELIAKLGRNSLSGGVFVDGEGPTFLVTGHDDKVLFRVAVPPPPSQVLSFEGEIAVPFTGQGIARDPRTGGLVGIDRARKQVLVAEPENPRRLRVLSYNIHHGEGVDGKLDLERIAGVILSVRPDVVALQEVDRNVPRSQTVDQTAELARLTRMEGFFDANISLQGGEYGNALLSRLPVARTTHHALPLLGPGEQRGVLEAEVALPPDAAGGTPRGVRLFATHFDHRPDNRERLASAAVLLDLLKQSPDTPAVLAGDLNDTPASAVLKRLGTGWSRGGLRDIPTIPAEVPKRQIDFVLAAPAEGWRVVDAHVLNEPVASDHRPLLVVLERVR